jgi:serine O-acetyltransferase
MGNLVAAETVVANPPSPLLAELHAAWVAHRRDWTRPGLWAVALNHLGRWRMRLPSRLLRWPLACLYWPAYYVVRNFCGIELPWSVQLGRGVVVEHQGGIVIHGNAVIGDACVIRQGVTLGNRDERSPAAAPRLGRGVSVGAGAKILGGVVIGDRARIGANAVVLIDVPAGATAVGVPARVVPAV